MGSLGQDPDEQPAHPVTLNPYIIDKYEVSTEQYAQCVQQHKCTPAHYDDGACTIWDGKAFLRVTVPKALRSPKSPVVCVSWRQAQEYCLAQGKRLPTEAQWEHAAKGGRGNAYSWGDQTPSAATCTQAVNRAPKPCGSFTANGYGLFDMTGNVWEWTADRYQKDYYAVAESINPTGPPAGLYRVVRGGGWYSNAGQLRITNRHWFEPSYSEVSIGFRCAK